MPTVVPFSREIPKRMPAFETENVDDARLFTESAEGESGVESEQAREMLEGVRESAESLEREVERKFGKEFMVAFRERMNAWKEETFRKGNEAMHALDARGFHASRWAQQLGESGNEMLENAKWNGIPIPKSKIVRYILSGISGAVGAVAPTGIVTLLPLSVVLAKYDPEAWDRKMSELSRSSEKPWEETVKSRLSGSEAEVIESGRSRY